MLQGFKGPHFNVTQLSRVRTLLSDHTVASISILEKEDNKSAYFGPLL